MTPNRSSRRDQSLQLAVTVSADAALLFSFILDDAQLTWSGLELAPNSASAIVVVSHSDVHRAVLALRQRLGVQLLEIALVGDQYLHGSLARYGGAG